MKIVVHIKSKVFVIPVGEGAQRIRWLGDVAVMRYDERYGMITGPPKGVRLENGTFLEMESLVSETIQEDQHVWIVLKEDMDVINLEAKKSKKLGGNSSAHPVAMSGLRTGKTMGQSSATGVPLLTGMPGSKVIGLTHAVSGSPVRRDMSAERGKTAPLGLKHTNAGGSAAKESPRGTRTTKGH